MEARSYIRRTSHAWPICSPDGTIYVRELVSTEPSETHLAMLEEGNSEGAGRYRVPSTPTAGL